MKVTDLMVGDWVNYKSPPSGKLQPVKIKNIYGVEFNCEVEYWNIKSGYSISDTEPIELTEEILVKNGFKKVNEHYECIVDKQLAGDGFEAQQIIIHSNNAVTIYTCIARILIHIDYVHQLQHLLRLVGVQKEIEL